MKLGRATRGRRSGGRVDERTDKNTPSCRYVHHFSVPSSILKGKSYGQLNDETKREKKCARLVAVEQYEQSRRTQKAEESSNEVTKKAS